MTLRKLQNFLCLIQNQGRALFRSLSSHIWYKRNLSVTPFQKRASFSSDNHDDTEEEEELEPLPVYDPEKAKRKLQAILEEGMTTQNNKSPLYELQSCKARKDRVMNLTIFDHYKRIYEQQNIRTFPHLQPNRMAGYGCRHAIVIPSQGSKVFKSYTKKIKSSVHKPREKTQ